MNTAISRCKKDNFAAFEKRGEKAYMLRWGKQDVVEQVFDPETHEPTGEIVETDMCTYESGLYNGVLTPYLLDKNAMSTAHRNASLAEYREIYNGMGVTDERQLPLLIEKLKAAINRYDKSSEVEDFTIGGHHLWLDSTMRSKVRENLETCQQKGEENTTLRFNGMAFPVTVTMGWQMYYAVLDYARESWNTTESHLAAVEKLETIEDVLAYDYKAGYPNKLAF